MLWVLKFSLLLILPEKTCMSLSETELSQLVIDLCSHWNIYHITLIGPIEGKRVGRQNTYNEFS